MMRVAISALAIALLAALAWLGTARAKEHEDREFQECRDCPVMIGIPSGTFLMGSSAQESGRYDSEGPQHEVTIKAFALGKYDVTSEEFQTFLKETGYRPASCNPMLNMGWGSAEDGSCRLALSRRSAALAGRVLGLARCGKIYRLAE